MRGGLYALPFCLPSIEWLLPGSGLPGFRSSGVGLFRLFRALPGPGSSGALPALPAALPGSDQANLSKYKNLMPYMGIFRGRTKLTCRNISRLPGSDQANLSKYKNLFVLPTVLPGSDQANLSKYKNLMPYMGINQVLEAAF